MKVFIWIFCMLLYALVIALLSQFGISLGGIPTILLGGLVFFAATSLCKLWDRKPHGKVDCRKFLDYFKQYNAPWPIVVLLIIFLLCSYFQNNQLRSEIDSLNNQISEYDGALEQEYDKGFEAGNDSGRSDGYEEGYQDGYKEGKLDGYTFGLTDCIDNPDSIDEYTLEYFRLRRGLLEQEQGSN